MPMDTIACPHCGKEINAKKRVCHHCQQEVGSPVDQGISKRSLRPKAAKPVVAQREMVPGEVIAAQPAAPPITRPRPTARPTEQEAGAPAPSAFLGASIKQRVQFYRQMYSLLRSGIPLGLSLGYMEGNIAVHLRPMVRDISDRISHGGLLSDCLARYPSVFPDWETSLVKAAETGGMLPEAMRDISETLELEMDLRYRVSASTFHLKATAFVFLLVLLIVAGVQGGVADINALFARLGAVLLQFAGIVVAGILIWQGWKAWGRSRTGSYVTQELAARIPVLGPLVRNMKRLRFARVLGALWGAGVAPMEALETAAKASGNNYLIQRIQDNVGLVGKGGTLSDVIGPTGIFPQEAMYLLQSGEASGTTAEALDKVAEYVEMELEAQAKTLPAKAQLIFYAIIVPLIAIFVISYYVGYFTKAMSGPGF